MGKNYRQVNWKKSTSTILFLKAVRVEKFTVDGNAFQMLMTVSIKTLRAARYTSWLIQLVLVTPCVSSHIKFE